MFHFNVPQPAINGIHSLRNDAVLRVARQAGLPCYARNGWNIGTGAAVAATLPTQQGPSPFGLMTLFRLENRSLTIDSQKDSERLARLYRVWRKGRHKIPS